MKLVLTRTDGQPILVNLEQVKLIESFPDGTTHIVFGSDLGRTVKETMAQIDDLIGASKINTAAVETFAKAAKRK